MEGWITLNRSLLDNFVWHGEPFTRGQAWVDLLLLANHAPTRTMIDGKVIDLEPGSYVTSIRRLADRWERSPKWTMKFLDLLESDNMIETQIVGNGNAKRTVLFIVKYGIYQASYVDEETQRKRSGTHKGNAKETQDGGKGVLDKPIYINNIQQGNNETMKQLPPISPTRDAFEEDFSEFWNLYPKKDGRKSALQSYIKARKNGTDKETILSGLNAYVAQCERRGTEKRYIAMASTWLNQERWDWDYTEQETTKPHEETMEEKIARWRKEGLWNHE